MRAEPTKDTQSSPVYLVSPRQAELNPQFLPFMGSIKKEKATVNRSGGRKSSSAHYCEKGAVKVSPSFILPPFLPPQPFSDPGNGS